MTDIDDPRINPDCRGGKHQACSGGGWDMSADRPCACGCECHTPKPKRVQMSRQRPWRAQHPDAVIVARPSRWGNPFRAVRRNGEWIVLDDNGVNYDAWPYPATKEGATGRAIELFETDVTQWQAIGFGPDDVRAALAGRDLACWCPLDQPCHADVLLELANGATS